MKSVKMFFGMMLCLVVLAGQAQAVSSLITFDGAGNYESLNDYGQTTDPKLIFSEEWGVYKINGNEYASEYGFNQLGEAKITFGTSVNDLSFDYTFAGFEFAKVNFYGDDESFLGYLDLENTNSFINISAGVFKNIKMIGFEIFTTGGPFTAGTINVDNIASSPVPLPGAAILLGSGLLGLIGLRRREII